jgi:hypothetical protein
MDPDLRRTCRIDLRACSISAATAGGTDLSIVEDSLLGTDGMGLLGLVGLVESSPSGLLGFFGFLGIEGLLEGTGGGGGLEELDPLPENSEVTVAWAAPPAVAPAPAGTKVLYFNSAPRITLLFILFGTDWVTDDPCCTVILLPSTLGAFRDMPLEFRMSVFIHTKHNLNNYILLNSTETLLSTTHIDDALPQIIVYLDSCGTSVVYTIL